MSIATKTPFPAAKLCVNHALNGDERCVQVTPSGDVAMADVLASLLRAKNRSLSNARCPQYAVGMVAADHDVPSVDVAAVFMPYPVLIVTKVSAPKTGLAQLPDDGRDAEVHVDPSVVTFVAAAPIISSLPPAAATFLPANSGTTRGEKTDISILKM